ncbi:MAG: inner membrane CreD family protein [Candidatus Coatesbacteria bacterium]|nr:MAG: inner membrane CreD family protein [Candidatus Coatesbacteria bacterium]
MTVLRTAAIIFIFFCSAVAWVILGGTLVHRTDQAKDFGTGAVGELWGTEQLQVAPRFYYKVTREVEVPAEEPAEGGTPTPAKKQIIEEPVFLEPAQADVDASLNLQHRKKGLLWFSTYVVEYRSTYRLVNDAAEPRVVFVEYSFPATNALYDDFTFRFKDQEVEFPSGGADYIVSSVELGPGETADVVIGYNSPGLDKWVYSFGDGVTRVRNFTLVARTDFKDVDFPEGCVSPTAKKETEEGWELTWAYKDLVTGYQLGVEMPKKLNPGPIASRMSFFAPVSLLFFFTVLFIISAVKINGVKPIHPMNYFFLAAAFFAFHLLFAYLADHVDIHLTFLISGVISCLLVFVYIALARSAKYALAYATFPQLMFLILFSYAFFYPGYTGLIITVGAIATLAVLMVATARVDWAAKFGAKKGD